MFWRNRNTFLEFDDLDEPTADDQPSTRRRARSSEGTPRRDQRQAFGITTNWRACASPDGVRRSTAAAAEVAAAAAAADTASNDAGAHTVTATTSGSCCEDRFELRGSFLDSFQDARGDEVQIGRATAFKGVWYSDSGSTDPDCKATSPVGKRSEVLGCGGAGAVCVESSIDYGDRPNTVMVKNLGCRCTPDMLMEYLDSFGMHGTYDVVYIPGRMSKGKSPTNFGYGFVSFKDPSNVTECYDRLHGSTLQFRNAVRKVEVVLAHQQGQHATGRRRLCSGRPTMELED